MNISRKEQRENKIMPKVEYRCNHCMIVESKWLIHSDRPADYITCRKCGLKSKKIATEQAPPPNQATLNGLERNKGKVAKFPQ